MASGSPRRKDFLERVGLEFLVRPCADEPAPELGEAPEAYAVRAACAKGAAIAREHPDAAVLAADTVVSVGEDILGKPADERETLQMLKKLCPPLGEPPRKHVVSTGCCIIYQGETRTLAVSTDVFMAPQPEATLTNYAKSGEALDKAGGYAIQGIGVFLVHEVKGSYSNVVGLPLARVLEVLLSWGVVSTKEG